jgi:hypothetical protein
MTASETAWFKAARREASSSWQQDTEPSARSVSISCATFARLL